MRPLALVILAGLLVPAASAAQGAAPRDSYIVVYDRDVASVNAETDERERRRGFRSGPRFRHAIKGFGARLTAEQVRALRADPDVDFVARDRPVRAFAAQPLPAGSDAPGGLRRIGAATDDWVREESTADVAVLDTGIDLEHPDLNAVNGTDCRNGDASADDDNGHGTHVAGRIGALNDGIGTIGVAPDTRVHAVKVLGADGKGSGTHLLCGIDWVLQNAAEKEIRVMNMSLGAGGPHKNHCGRESADPNSPVEDPLHAAICRARDAGLLTVAAAGNGDPNTGDGQDISQPLTLPAAYPEVLTVSAMADFDGVGGGNEEAVICGEEDDTPASFSNFAVSAEDSAHMIAAPGVCTTSTWPLDDPRDVDPQNDGYHALSGTSMAAPHVTAAAALCIGEAGAAGPCAGMTPGEIIVRMRADAQEFREANPVQGFEGDPTDSPGGDYYGHLVRPVLNGPQTVFTATPVGPTADQTPTFEFGSPTPGTTLECSVDGAAFEACASPHTTASLADGPHSLAVRAVDVAGDRDASPAVDLFSVDTTPDPPPPPPPDPGTGSTGITDPQPVPPDLTPPTAKLTLSSRQKIASVSRNGLRVSVSCSEPCRLTSTVVLGSGIAKKLGLVRSGSLVAGIRESGLAAEPRKVTIRLTSRVRRALARRRSVLVQVRVLTTDAAGNSRTFKRSVRLVA